MTTETDGKKTRVLILGGGHSSVRAAQRLLRRRRRKDNLEVVVVSRENYENWHGLMPQIGGGLVQPQFALVPLRQLLPGAILYNYDIERIDLANRCVTLDRGPDRDRLVLTYDYLILALGSILDFSRFPGMFEHALQTKTVADMFHLRNHVLDMLERATVEEDPEERQRMLTFVVAGAGLAGAEIGGQVHHLIRQSLRFYPTIQPSEIRFVVVSHSARIMPAINDGPTRRAMRYMRRTGVDLRLGVAVASATANKVVLTTGESIPTRTIIATAGIRIHPLIESLPIPIEDGRIACDRYCRVPGWPGVYAIGDIAAIPNKAGKPYPATGFVAFAHGRYAAGNILAELRGRRLKPTFYMGMDAVLLNKHYAIGQFRWGRLTLFQLEGPLASLVWRTVMLISIQTWGRRFELLTDWLVSAFLPRDTIRMQVDTPAALRPMRFEAGEIIVRQGEAGDRFYMIEEGRVEVLRGSPDDGEQRITSLGSGQHFGADALTGDHRRAFTVRALTDARLLTIARADLTQLAENLPGLREILGVEQPDDATLAALAGDAPVVIPSPAVPAQPMSAEQMLPSLTSAAPLSNEEPTA